MREWQAESNFFCTFLTAIEVCVNIYVQFQEKKTRFYVSIKAKKLRLYAVMFIRLSDERKDQNSKKYRKQQLNSIRFYIKVCTKLPGHN